METHLRPPRPRRPATRHSLRTSFSWMSLSLFSDSVKLSMAPTPGPGPRCWGAALLPLRFQPVERKVGEGDVGLGTAVGCRVWPQPPSGEEMVARPMPCCWGSSALRPPRTTPGSRPHRGPSGLSPPRGTWRGGWGGTSTRSPRRIPGLPAAAWYRDRDGTCGVRLRAPSCRHLYPAAEVTTHGAVTRGSPPGGAPDPGGRVGHGARGRGRRGSGHCADGNPPAFPRSPGPFLCPFHVHDTSTNS